MNTIRELLVHKFDLNITEEELNHQKMIDLLADKIAYMLEYQLEQLFSMMYRLDVSEEKLKAALMPNAEEPANVGLAKLIIERQMQRLHTKAFYKQEELGSEEALKW